MIRILSNEPAPSRLVLNLNIPPQSSPALLSVELAYVSMKAKALELALLTLEELEFSLFIK